MLPLVQRIQRSVPTAATTDIYLPRVPPGQLWRITHLALSDDAAGDITVIFGDTDIVGFRALTDKYFVQTGFTAWYAVNILAGEENLITARIITTTGAGQVTFVVSGEVHLIDPSAYPAAYQPPPSAEVKT